MKLVPPVPKPPLDLTLPPEGEVEERACIRAASYFQDIGYSHRTNSQVDLILCGQRGSQKVITKMHELNQEKKELLRSFYSIACQLNSIDDRQINLARLWEERK